MDLSRIRSEIDDIDQQLTDLLCRRLDRSRQVAEYKRENGIPVLNEAREREVLDGVERRSDASDPDHHGYGRANRQVYSTVMEVSRAMQHRLLGGGDALRAELKHAARTLKASPRVVCQGARGSFSHEATSALFSDATPQFLPQWKDVVEAVKNGDADYGVLPLENSSTGSVHEVYDLLIQNRCRIAAAVELPVEQCLLTLPGVSPDEVKTVVSHPQALAQCGDFLKQRGYAERRHDNTATAAELVASTGDRTLAAIGSKAAAAEYGLQTAIEGIQTFGGNTTRFVAISRELCIPEDADRITLLFCLPHTTGSLYHTLGRFALEGLNLTKLESRPLKTGRFEYAFYLDFEGNARSEHTVSLLCALSDELPQFTLLGNYKEKAME